MLASTWWPSTTCGVSSDYVGEIPPVVGSVRFYRIAALRDSMQLILLTLVD